MDDMNASAIETLQAHDVDDCWNRIGIRGDGSCPQLPQHVRCLNCPTYAEAAVLLLDRVAQGTGQSGAWMQTVADVAHRADAVAEAGADTAMMSALVFRVGAEWLALPTEAVIEVTAARAMHSLPHQRNRAVLGVQNIRGALRICVSLGRLFQIEEDRQDGKQMVVSCHEGQTLVFPVDEVAGVHRASTTAVLPPPTTLAHAATRYMQGLLDWRSRKVGLLDHGLLFHALNRSMA